ncbi:MCE family protein [Mycobacterium sp. 3519A]|uniref:MCE family protein n=1 Tax=Mycobacterium sp. 3519A TaxID=2057184 RepID=UPI000C7C1EB0|nr:MCE family protein [Mycobacterium sp. 3519A]
MKPVSERNLGVVGAVGVGVTVGVIAAALQFDKLPIWNSKATYSAYFAEAGGLQTGEDVQIAGYKVGKVSDIDLQGARVLVTFDVTKDIHLGDRTEAAVKTKSLLGVKVLEITPRGTNTLQQTIPLERTTPAYELTDALQSLSNTVDAVNSDALNASLSTLANEFAQTPPQLRLAVDGVSRFSKTLAERDESLRQLLTNARRSIGVLAERSDHVVRLIADSNALLHQLQLESAALDRISADISAFAEQLRGFIQDNHQQLPAALDKVNAVLAIVDGRKDKVQEAIKKVAPYMLALGEAVSAGPFFKPYLANLLPGQFIQPFVDAAFSDLGLDPNVLAPSQLTDPQTGQPGTPALPVPYPRTGQGGEPNLTLPDAITGHPGDPRYPYRPPLPAPPPGGPPPGAPGPGVASSPPTSPETGAALTPSPAPPDAQAGQ